MMQIRSNEARGKASSGWLDSRHTFSFGHYFDPQHMRIPDQRDRSFRLIVTADSGAT